MGRTRRGQRVGIAVLLRDGVEQPLLLARDFLLGKRRVLHDVGDDAQRRRQVPFQHIEATRALSRPAPPVSVGAQIAERLLDLQRIARLRPQVDDRRGQLRHTGLAGRIAHRARARDQRHVQLRKVGALQHQHLEPVLELGCLHRGRNERPILAKRRLLRPIQRQGIRRALPTSRDGSG